MRIVEINDKDGLSDKKYYMDKEKFYCCGSFEQIRALAIVYIMPIDMFISETTKKKVFVYVLTDRVREIVYKNKGKEKIGGDENE